MRFDNGAIGTIEATRFATGRKNAFSWEINGSKGSLAFDLERLNELADQRRRDRARRVPHVLVSEADHPFWGWWWPHGHMIGWEHTFVHELHHLLEAIREQTAIAPARRDVRGRLPGIGGVRRDHRRRRHRPAPVGALPVARGLTLVFAHDNGDARRWEPES